MSGIFHIAFNLADFGLNAVVVADSPEQAISALGFDDEVITSCTAIDVWTGGPIDGQMVICRESL